MNLWINLIELTLMTLIEPLQLDHSLQNCDNSIYIGLMISNLFYNMFVQFCFCSVTKTLLKFRFHFNSVFSHFFPVPTNYTLKFPVLYISKLKSEPN